MLARARDSADLVEIETMIARASSLHAVHVSNFQSTFDLMIELGGDVIPMYRRIVRSICTNNKALRESCMKERTWVGWLDDETLSSIHIDTLGNSLVIYI